jgi:hypothetical protein
MTYRPLKHLRSAQKRDMLIMIKLSACFICGSYTYQQLQNKQGLTVEFVVFRDANGSGSNINMT